MNILAEMINAKIIAYKYCRTNGNLEWEQRHQEALYWIATNLLPRGSGFDSGTEIDRELSGPDKLVFKTSYHHMDENGGYTHWTHHTVYCRPTFLGRIVLTVSGPSDNYIKDHIGEAFYEALAAEFDGEAADKAMYMRNKQ